RRPRSMILIPNSGSITSLSASSISSRGVCATAVILPPDPCAWHDIRKDLGARFGLFVVHVAFVFQTFAEFFATRVNDLAINKYVNEIWFDVAQDTCVVSIQHGAHIVVFLRTVDAC